MRFALPLIVLSAVALAAAQAPQPASAPAPAPAAIPGIIVDDANQPVLRARLVDVSSHQVLAISDQDGRIAVPRPTAAVNARILKNGYLGQLIQIQPRASSVSIALTRAGVISGQVVDEVGDPIPRLSVTAQRVDRRRGSRAGIDTDDRGEFRLAGLEPGEYVVGVPGGCCPSTFYFPGTNRIEEAERITVQPGMEYAGVSFIAPPAPSRPGTLTAQNGTSLLIGIGEPGTSAVRGVVTDIGGRPIRRAEVMITARGSSSGPFRRTIFTEPDGRFAFEEVPGGRYRVATAARNYIAGMVNGTRYGVEDVEFAEGETKSDVSLTLVPWSVVTGRVVDEFGDPMTGALVQALRLGYDAGRRQLVPAGSARRTDDTGSYRLFGLPPGDYILRATIGDVSSADVPGYSPTYYPGTSDPALARYVTLQPGDASSGLDIPLDRARTFNVAGLMFDSSGAPTMGGGVSLSASWHAGAVSAAPVGARIPREGVFEFANVTPGLYVVQAYRGRLNRWTEGEFGTATVSVSDADVKDVVVRMTKGSSITGRIVLEGTADAPPPSLSSLDITPVPVDFDQAPRDNWAVAAIDRSLSFRLAGISGVRRLEVESLPKGWGLAGIVVNGIDITDQPLRFGSDRESLRDVEIRLTSLPSLLRGSVTTAASAPAARAPVIVFSTDSERWYPRSRYLRRASTDEAGRYMIEGVPPGTYYVASPGELPRLGEGAWEEPAYLQSLMRDAQIVTIADALHTTANISRR